MSEKKITGYKGFDKDFACRGKKYEVGKKFQQNGRLELCSNGIHFCEMPLDVFNYYPPEPGNQYAQVESFGCAVKGDDKVCVRGIKVKSKISIAGLFKAHFDIIVSKIKDKVKESADTMNTAGYKAHANTAGYKAHANTAGNYAHANTAGDYAHANTAGDYAHANTAGYKAHANTAGNYAHANTAGNYAHANTAGYKAHANTAGKQSIACSLGYRSKARASKGWILVVDWRLDGNSKYYIKDIHKAKVGKGKIKGTEIEPDTWYWFEDGELKFEKQ